MQYIIRYRQEILKQNLKLAFPAISETKLNKIIKGVYYNLACFIVELLQSWRLNKEFYAQNFNVHNRDVFEKALNENKGLILLTGHLANFEWTGSYVGTEYPPVYAVMKRLHNPYINNLIVKTREKMGFKLLYTRDTYKKALEELKNNNIVAFIADQDARHKGVFVDFFGTPASTAKGAAILHLKTGAPIIVGINIRRGWGKFDLYCERVPTAKDLKLTEENIFAITEAHTKILEKWISKYPEQYLWTHKRWKTKPW